MSSNQKPRVTRTKVSSASRVINQIFEQIPDLEPTLSDPAVQRRQAELFDGSQRYRFGPREPDIALEQHR